MEADTDRDGKISFEEFTKMVENTDVSMSMTLGTLLSFAVHVLHHCSWLLMTSPPRAPTLPLTLPQTNSSRYPEIAIAETNDMFYGLVDCVKPAFDMSYAG